MKGKRNQPAESTPVSAPARKMRRRGNALAALEDALVSAIVVDPVVVQVSHVPGRPGLARVPAGKIDPVPVKIFRPEDFPGISVWTEKAYVDDGFNLTASHADVEECCGREVVDVVGYAMHDTMPFCLVMLALKDNESSLRVKDAVQAVHNQLAAQLFPKAYATFMHRLVAQLSQQPQPPSAETGGVKREENGEEEDEDAGPSTSTPALGRGCRRK